MNHLLKLIEHMPDLVIVGGGDFNRFIFEVENKTKVEQSVVK
jgi:predicted phage gp36 major capsid-like protein